MYIPPAVAFAMDHQRRRTFAQQAVASGGLTIEQASRKYEVDEDTIRADLERTRKIKEEYGEEPF